MCDEKVRNNFGLTYKIFYDVNVWLKVNMQKKQLENNDCQRRLSYWVANKASVLGTPFTSSQATDWPIDQLFQRLANAR